MESRNRRYRRDLIGFVLLLVLVSLAWEGWRRWQDGGETETLVALAQPGDIRMISSVTCVFCTQARLWMKEHQVPFDECFIEKDPACMQTYQALMSPGTPVVLVRGQRQVGFRVSRVVQRLESSPPSAAPSQP